MKKMILAVMALALTACAHMNRPAPDHLHQRLQHGGQGGVFFANDAQGFVGHGVVSGKGKAGPTVRSANGLATVPELSVQGLDPGQGQPTGGSG